MESKSKEKLDIESVNNTDKNSNLKGDIYIYLLKKILYFPIGRNLLLKQLQKKVYNEAVEKNTKFPKNVQIKKYEMVVAALETITRNIDRGYISKEYGDKAINNFIKYNLTQPELVEDIKENFEKKYGVKPPFFAIISPTQKCGLKCLGCYASSTINAPTLPYDIVDKIVGETFNEWGCRFMTITGGEPLMYNSHGKTLFNIWEKYPQMFFLFYTNGILINKEIAEKLEKLGNVTPAISVEGFEKETDERRGKGVYKKILEAAKNLREAGVPFGVSITATSKNIDLLLEDKFYDYVFQELGATYMWMFQLMPIGQAKDMKECMITPKQRINLYRKWEYLIKEKKYPIADFWNSGVLSNGCIAYGRDAGYLYVDWNGNIMPCVFVPYYEDNIIDLYSKDKKLADALFSQLFINGRKWQDKVGFAHMKDPDNWLMPCSIRDNYSNFKKNIITKNTKPEDICAKQAIESEEYEKVLEEFDKEVEKLTLPIWKKEYLEDN